MKGQTQAQTQTATTQPTPLPDRDWFNELLEREFKPSTVIKPTEPAKRFVKVSEITAEVEVEREIDFGYSVCSWCLERTCSCTPRIEQRFTQRISYPVTMVVATVIALA